MGKRRRRRIVSTNEAKKDEMRPRVCLSVCSAPRRLGKLRGTAFIGGADPVGSNEAPGIVAGDDDGVGEGSFIEGGEVVVEMSQGRGADDDAVIFFKVGMVFHPSEGGVGRRDGELFARGEDEIAGVELDIVEVPRAVHGIGFIETRPVGEVGNGLTLNFPR